MAVGGKWSFTSTKEGGAEKNVLAMLKWGWGTTSFEVVLTRELEVLAIGIGGGGRKKCPPFKVRLRWLGAVLQYPGKI